MDRVETAMFIERKIKKYIKDIKEIDGKVMEDNLNAIYDSLK